MEPGAIKPLRLEAMTLRGLGSYLHGGRLEIRPLTVLCGTNGSGKSTWFRMIDLLRQSKNTLPFEFQEDVWHGEGWHGYTNAFVEFEDDPCARLASAEQDREFGGLGTVGLHVVADLDFDLDGAAQSPRPEGLSEITFDHESVAQSFLWAGRCRRGTRFRLRMSNANSMSVPTSRLPRCAELVIGDDFVIRFEGTAVPGRFDAACTRAFWPGYESDDLTVLEVASFELGPGVIPTNIRGPDGAEGFDLLEQFCAAAIARIRQLLDLFLCGTFLLRAIRPPRREGGVPIAEMNDESVMEERSVGDGGEFAHALGRRFAYNLMNPAAESGGGRTNYRYTRASPKILDVLLESESHEGMSLARTIWEGVDAGKKEKIRRLRSALDPLYPHRDAEWAVCLLNEALTRRDLYHTSMWIFPSEEARVLAQQRHDRRDDREIEQFNRELIDNAFPEFVDRHPGLIFDTYYFVWLEKLLGTSGENRIYWTDPENPPIGYLDRFLPDDARADWFAGSAGAGTREEERRNLILYTGRLFGETGLPAAPVHMSSGFHQVAPMVVQAGLMKQNEVLCIENPEVHLHPKLQLGVTEFLIRQAKIGKTILVETHSDLVVRRVVRAILEEDIKQEAVRIHFADVDVDSTFFKEVGYASSRIEVIKIDERGRIRNWPAGFMDDDVRESRRLLDIMYGPTPEEEEEKEDRGSNDS